MIWFQRAAEQGYPVAKLYLGVMYAEGRGASQEPPAWIAAMKGYRRRLDLRYAISANWENGDWPFRATERPAAVGTQTDEIKALCDAAKRWTNLVVAEISPHRK
jgi:TPR repeat protein